MTKKLKAREFVDLLNEIKKDEVNELMSLSHKTKLILAAGKLGKLLLFIFSDFSLLEFNRQNEALTFPFSKLNDYKSNLTPKQRKTVDEIVDKAIDKALTSFREKATKDDHD